jgi:hypothetical protein
LLGKTSKASSSFRVAGFLLSQQKQNKMSTYRKYRIAEGKGFKGKKAGDLIELSDKQASAFADRIVISEKLKDQLKEETEVKGIYKPITQDNRTRPKVIRKPVANPDSDTNSQATGEGLRDVSKLSEGEEIATPPAIVSGTPPAIVSGPPK